ncbi:hypothetical protein COU54_00545 [Candidatus Pacearchaeota archaeon CG10_big_fil_rev_8_21_14_0_10_31_24]|nr:MAG: hypothetical protein COU54_00545 [Candidatus Pacearchaeota archaeon CG10_big_fil_rev_8_21_14_0_10_31_24]
MNKNKPHKTEYINQEEIYEKIISALKNSHLNELSESYLIGSLTEKKFGIYDKEYEGFSGSDIDIVAILKNEIPSTWGEKETSYKWHKKYFGGIIKINHVEHPISFMIPLKKNLEEFWKIAKELNWKVKKIK